MIKMTTMGKRLYFENHNNYAKSIKAHFFKLYNGLNVNIGLTYTLKG